MSTWLILHTPTGVHCWDLGNPDDDVRAALFNAARVAVGFPPNDEWMTTPNGYDAQMSQGEPHHTLLERAVTVGSSRDLRKVDQTAVEDHTVARRAATAELATRMATVPKGG